MTTRLRIARVASDRIPHHTYEVTIFVPGKGPWVTENFGRWECTCPNWRKHGTGFECKHILRVQKMAASVEGEDQKVYFELDGMRWLDERRLRLAVKLDEKRRQGVIADKLDAALEHQKVVVNGEDQRLSDAEIRFSLLELD